MATSAEEPELQSEQKEKWRRIQDELKEQLIDEDRLSWNGRTLEDLHFVGGVDISFVKDDNINAIAALVVLSFPDLKVVYEDCRHVLLTQPYISGFLAFREVPFLVEQVDRLRKEHPKLLPQVILVDGNGILHHRGFGLASHLGVLIDIPTIGVAKKLLHVDGMDKNSDALKEGIAGLKKGGDTFELKGLSGKVWGVALRSVNGSRNPVFVSRGHRICLESTVRIVTACCRFRIPEPTRQADLRSRRVVAKTPALQAPVDADVDAATAAMAAVKL